MPRITYEIVEHDGGWAYRVGDVYSETHPTRELAHKAAEDAAARQELDGETEIIQYEDEAGTWHEEVAGGSDRPETSVKDE